MNSAIKDNKESRRFACSIWQEKTQLPFLPWTLSFWKITVPSLEETVPSRIYLDPRTLFALYLSRLLSESLSNLLNVISCVCSNVYGTLHSFYTHKTPIPYQLRISNPFRIETPKHKRFPQLNRLLLPHTILSKINSISFTKITLILYGVFLLKHKYISSTHGIYTKMYTPYVLIFLSKIAPHFVPNYLTCVCVYNQ